MAVIKQVIVIRKDLPMTKGKAVAQGSHASLSAYLKAYKSDSKLAFSWIEDGQTKVVLKVDSEEELLGLYEQVVSSSDLNVYLVKDKGNTQLVPGTYTALAIGPALSEEIDHFTNHLKLY